MMEKERRQRLVKVLWRTGLGLLVVLVAIGALLPLILLIPDAYGWSVVVLLSLAVFVIPPLPRRTRARLSRWLQGYDVMERQGPCGGSSEANDAVEQDD